MDCDRPTLADSELLQPFQDDTEDEDFVGFTEDDLPVPLNSWEFKLPQAMSAIVC